MSPNANDTKGKYVGSVEVTPNGPVGPAMVIADALVAVAKPREIVATRAIAELLREAPVTCEPLADQMAAMLGQTWELCRIVPD